MKQSEASISGTSIVKTEAVREQMDRILASKHFRRSDRLNRFLRFSVEQTLAGTADQVKEQVVGIQVFDRKADYDPRIDPIVRVEARRLRSKLDAYYAREGKSEAFAIDFPKGAYTVVFVPRNPSDTTEPIPRAREMSIAVLPFTNLTARNENDFFSDGLTEELIHLLTRVQELRVVSWNSASRLRGREQDLDAIRDQLKAGLLLRGSIRRSVDRVRVAVQLIDTVSGAYLWSEIYDRPMQDAFSIEVEIARAIVVTLRLALTTPGERRVATKPNADCYTLCLQGRFHANRRTPEGLEKSVACYEQAILADPESAEAHAGLADAYSLLGDYGVVTVREIVGKARAAAERALTLDPMSAEANVALAFIRSIYDWDWEEAGELYNRALAANPSYARGRHWYSVDYLAMLKRTDEALTEIEIARKLDPLSQIIAEGRGFVNTLARRYPEACVGFRETINLDPTFYKAYAGMGRLYCLMGRFPEALEMLHKAHSMAGDVPNVLSALGQTLAVSGKTADARAILNRLTELAAYRPVPATSFGIVHMGLGEIDKALEYFESACDQREGPAVAYATHPLYDPVRDQPRFQALIARMGLLP